MAVVIRVGMVVPGGGLELLWLLVGVVDWGWKILLLSIEVGMLLLLWRRMEWLGWAGSRR